MKLSRTHIALLIGLAMVIITINAAYRVRYFGQVEARQQEEARRRAEAGDGGADLTEGGAPSDLSGRAPSPGGAQPPP